ncbi:MAG: fumarate hydratase [Candidatus Izemoplasmatales bacterium]|nr:fumarate hydratase [bacterium]MDZ4196247.1 fumarate hydratase [Candidatus Izemoplasmatales bacterium]
MNITREDVIREVKKIVVDAACNLDPEMVRFLQLAKSKETAPLAKTILSEIIQNQEIARNQGIPMCQDTGVSVFFVELGNQVRLDFDLVEAINEATRLGYKEGFLRKSIVAHPIDRVNTKDNTPAVIHIKLVMGDTLHITFAPKGAGSENLSRMKMMTPAEGIEDVIAFVKETILLAGGKACPPLIVGIGIGGNFELAPLIAKEAIFRPLTDEATHPINRELEVRLMKEINELPVGAMGLGGVTTCLAVKVNSYPCHIASFPVAVNLQCHAARHKEITLGGNKHEEI